MSTKICKNPLNTSFRAGLPSLAGAAGNRQHAHCGAARADRLAFRGNSPDWDIPSAVHAANQVNSGSMLARPTKFERLRCPTAVTCRDATGGNHVSCLHCRLCTTALSNRGRQHYFSSRGPQRIGQCSARRPQQSNAAGWRSHIIAAASGGSPSDDPQQRQDSSDYDREQQRKFDEMNKARLALRTASVEWFSMHCTRLTPVFKFEDHLLASHL